jgi:hypothetical protein
MWSGVDTPTCWHNLVTCCYECNNKKRDRTPEQAGMPLVKIVNGGKIQYKRPKRPNYVDLVLGASGLSLDHIPNKWMIYFSALMSKDERSFLV